MADLIDRQAVLDTLDTYWKNEVDKIPKETGFEKLASMCDTILKYSNAIAKLIKHLSSAQPEQQWIPCSQTEDLPEHEVLCCDKYGEELIGWLSCEDDQWLCESDGEMMYDPIAWREKPEPWRGEEHETD